MAIGNLFKKKNYIKLNQSNVQNAVKKGDFQKCKQCGEILFKDSLIENEHRCQTCGYNFRINASERLNTLVDKDSFKALEYNFESNNPLSLEGYEYKLKSGREKSGLEEAVIIGEGEIGGTLCAIGVMDSSFMMGSMGSVVGDMLTTLIEYATVSKLPLIIITASGGARMQEGIFSLMQMAKTSSALKRHSDKGNLYISLLTDPTTGGVSASFAMLGDIILAEPGALIGFAGPRVIKQTIRQELPEGFQSAEFLLEKGFIDKIVPRQRLNEVLAQILTLHKGRKYAAI